jgi:hypothetical protein
MIDTIRVEFGRKLQIRRQSLSERELKQLKGHDTVLYNDDRTGFRLIRSGRGRTARVAEVSLSRIHFNSRSNFRPLTCQQDVDAALRKLEEKICHVCRVAPKKLNYHFSRVDLAWNYRISPQHFIFAHDHSTHPMLEKQVVSYRRGNLVTGLVFEGHDALIKFYDQRAKVAEEERSISSTTSQSSRILRIEVQLRGKRLKSLFGFGNAYPKRLDFSRCYVAYRSVLLGFRDSVEPVCKVSTKDEAIFYAESKGLRIIRHLLNRMSGQAKRNFRNNYQSWLKRNSPFVVDWGAMLPLQPPPPVIKSPIVFNNRVRACLTRIRANHESPAHLKRTKATE